MRPDVQTGARVKVLALAAGRPVPADPYGEVLPPGHQEPSGPANRVIAVRFSDGTIRDATSWEPVTRHRNLRALNAWLARRNASRPEHL